MSDKNKNKSQEDPISRSARKAERAVIKDGLDNDKQLEQSSTALWEDGEVMDFGVVDLDPNDGSSLPPHPDKLPNESPLESIDNMYATSELQPKEELQAPKPSPSAYQPTPKPITRPSHLQRGTTGKSNYNPTPVIKTRNTRLLKSIMIVVCLAIMIGAIILGIGYMSEREDQKQKEELELLDQKSRDALLDSAVKKNQTNP